MINNKKKFLIILLAIIVLLLVVGSVSVYYFKQGKPSRNIFTTDDNNKFINPANFNCSENKTIQALFFKDRVELSLSDGRNMLISQAVSASGARYANTDESFVFWNKGDTAFINEGDKTTFKDCLISTDEASTTPQKII
jgi:membrane-bound inhibitor of C-type lysozyme